MRHKVRDQNASDKLTDSERGGGSGALYVVAVPIGNAEDITARAIRVMREADLIACEDTRRTGRMLADHNLRTPCISYYEHNEDRRIPELIEKLATGATIALVTDAGTPAISDPGFRLVRAAIASEVPVKAVPGPAAVISALSISGLPTDRFVFEGFLPSRAGERQRRLAELRREPRTMVFYEAARRLPETLAAMIEMFSAKRQGVVLREMTKTYEEAIRGPLGEIAEHFGRHAPLGEITLIVAGAEESDVLHTQQDVNEAMMLEVLRDAGLSLKAASAVIAKLSGASRREIYQRALLTKP
jgi:16S rRNA (cytidine1402-2'-O)-methyltransferase